MILTLMIEPNKKPMRYYAKPTEDSLRRAVSIGYEDIHDIKIKHMEDDVYLVHASNISPLEHKANRRIAGEIISGTFLIVRINGSKHLVSLTEEDVDVYRELFETPEVFSAEEAVTACVDQILAEIENP